MRSLIHALISKSRLSSLVLLLLILSGCSGKLPPADMSRTLYLPISESVDENKFIPYFESFGTERAYNRIGTPVAAGDGAQPEQVFVDPSRPAIFTERRLFSTSRGFYTNLIHRIHFSEIPTSIFPFYLGAGKNIGLFVIVTLNSSAEPLLYTIVHTCGCYLAFIPTSYLWPEAFPASWSLQTQGVYGETLPGLLDLHNPLLTDFRVGLKIRNETHRVMDITIEPEQKLRSNPHVPMQIKPLAALENLQDHASEPVSFFEQSGARKDYVKESGKMWERILMSWWALDWRIGEDKRLGKDAADGLVFYTSIKPWQRVNSDMRNFSRFLNYWGWKL
ncbi:MAG: hypothetical protein D6B25_02700 [Desulfobulbaceae bacterium]|nr:MAG: hypothetical protein D6B25_02700 [Desulfobulbaceae bacterium]